MPQLLGLGAHAFGHHGHTEGTDGHGVEWSGLAKALVHGHGHEEGVPDHEHHLRPAPPLKTEAPRGLQAPAIATLQATEAGHLTPASAQPRWERTRLSGSSPPRFHFLCTLLI